MARFAKMHIGSRKNFDPNALAPEVHKAVTDGMTNARKVFRGLQGQGSRYVGSGPRRRGLATGRAMLKNDYMARIASAVMGIYGNTKDEAMYPAYFRDADGQMLNGADRYVLRFKLGAIATGTRLLVSHDVRAAVESALCQPNQSLSDQLIDARKSQA